MASDQLSTSFAALADPTRRAILGRLAAGDATVSELSAPFSMSQPAISKHLTVLEKAGLISRRRSGTATISHLEAAPLRAATTWMQTYQEFWERSFNRLDALLEEQSKTESEGENNG